jgi:hypothetical protein
MERLEPFPVLAGTDERDEDPGGGGGDQRRRHLGLVTTDRTLDKL